MSVEITYTAKCKHCDNFEQGTRKKHSRCKATGTDDHVRGGSCVRWRLACDKFKL